MQEFLDCRNVSKMLMAKLLNDITKNLEILTFKLGYSHKFPKSALIWELTQFTPFRIVSAKIRELTLK